MQETQVQSLGGEDPLEKATATCSSILAWRIPRTEKPGGLQSMGSQRVGHNWVTFSSVQFIRSVVSDSLRPHGLHHARLPCPSPTPGAYSTSCTSSQWCHPTISSSVVPFSSCPQTFPASGSCAVRQLITLGGQSIGAPALGNMSKVRETENNFLHLLKDRDNYWPAPLFYHKHQSIVIPPYNLPR